MDPSHTILSTSNLDTTASVRSDVWRVNAGAAVAAAEAAAEAAAAAAAEAAAEVAVVARAVVEAGVGVDVVTRSAAPSSAAVPVARQSDACWRPSSCLVCLSLGSAGGWRGRSMRCGARIPIE